MAYTITGAEKLKIIEKFVRQIKKNKKIEKVVDWGGNKETSIFIKNLLPDAKIYSANNYKKELIDCENPILLDAEKTDSFKEQSIDCVFCLDIIEHLVNPDNLIKTCEKELKRGGS